MDSYGGNGGRGMVLQTKTWVRNSRVSQDEGHYPELRPRPSLPSPIKLDAGLQGPLRSTCCFSECWIMESSLG